MLNFKLRGRKSNKWADRYVGIPLLALLTLFNRIFYHRSQAGSKKLLAIQIVSIGDAVLTLPSLRYLKKEGFEIIVLTSRANDSIYQLEGYKTILFQLEDFVRHPFQFISKIRQEKFGYVLDFLPWARLSALLCGFFKSNSTLLVGFKTAHQHRSSIYDFVFEHSNQQHEVDNFFELTKKVKNSTLPSKTFWEVLSSEKINARVDHPKFIQKIGFDPLSKSYIVFHPWAGGYRGTDREWALENYLALADRLPPSLSVIVTGTEEDLGRAEIFRNRPRIDVLAGKTNLVETMFLLKHAKAVVSVNTGVLHLASWVGANVVTLNGPTNDKRWSGLQIDPHQIIINRNAKVPCSPCLNLGFEYACKTMFCMPTISIQEVDASLKSLL